MSEREIIIFYDKSKRIHVMSSHLFQYLLTIVALWLLGIIAQSRPLVYVNRRLDNQPAVAMHYHHRHNRGHSQVSEAFSSNGFRLTTSDGSDRVHVFYINLRRDHHRRHYMEQLLSRMPDVSYQRVEAISPASPEYNIVQLEKPCKRNTPHDLSVIMSHLKAIYTAVTTVNSSDYALILEDDVRLLYNIDLGKLVTSLPVAEQRSFGILQLVTSNIEAIDLLWNKFSQQQTFWTPNNWNDVTKDKKTTLYWSAQAYLINIPRIRGFIEDVVEAIEGDRLGFKLVNSFFPTKCIRTKAKPCVLANCLFSDSYIYSGGGPTYVSHIPLFNGANVSLQSSLHQDHVVKHTEAFARIDQIAAEVVSDYKDRISYIV